MDLEKRIKEFKKEFINMTAFRRYQSKYCYLFHGDPDFVSTDDWYCFHPFIPGDLNWKRLERKKYFLESTVVYGVGESYGQGEKSMLWDDQLLCALGTRPDLENHVIEEGGKIRLTVDDKERFDIFCRLNLIISDLYFKYMKALFRDVPKYIRNMTGPGLNFYPGNYSLIAEFENPYKTRYVYRVAYHYDYETAGRINHHGFWIHREWTIPDSFVMFVRPPKHEKYF